jgi:hypothetical protein
VSGRPVDVTLRLARERLTEARRQRAAARKRAIEVHVRRLEADARALDVGVGEAADTIRSAEASAPSSGVAKAGGVVRGRGVVRAKATRRQPALAATPTTTSEGHIAVIAEVMVVVEQAERLAGQPAAAALGEQARSLLAQLHSEPEPRLDQSRERLREISENLDRAQEHAELVEHTEQAFRRALQDNGAISVADDDRSAPGLTLRTPQGSIAVEVHARDDDAVDLRFDCRNSGVSTVVDDAGRRFEDCAADEKLVENLLAPLEADGLRRARKPRSTTKVTRGVKPTASKMRQRGSSR